MNWKKIVICTFCVACLVAFGCFYINGQNKLTCFRENGDKIDVTFDASGINKIYINDKKMKEEEAEIYKLRFMFSFKLISSIHDSDEIIPKYIEKVREYEESNKAICR